MNDYLALRVTVLLGFCLTSTAFAVPSQEDTKVAAELKRNLSQNDLFSFVQYVKRHTWRPPVIHSAWYVEKLKKDDPKQSAAEVEKRVLGKQLLDAIDDVTASISEGNPSAVAQRCRLLLDLSEWILQQDGYGNIILAGKSCDLASVGIGHLVADLKCPLADAKDLLLRLKTVGPQASHVVGVLNDEAGGRDIFDTTVPTRDALLKKWESVELRMQFSALKAKAPEQAKKLQATLSKMNVDTHSVVEDADIFQDADLPEYPTTQKCWDSKHHKQLVLGLASQNIRELEALLTFREKVGTFPVRPKQPGFPHMSEGKAAFREAWLPHATQENRTLYATAWAAYQQITSGTFVDQDTQMMRQEKMRQAIATP